MKTTLLAACWLACQATGSLAAPLFGELDLVWRDRVVAKPNGGELVLTDVYHLFVDNPNADPVTAVSLYLPGDYSESITLVPYKDTTDFQVFFGNPVAESFFVLPFNTSAHELAVGQVFTQSLIASNHTLTGGVSLIEPEQKAVQAVLSVPAGHVPDFRRYRGAAVVNGVIEPILFVPEPMSSVLAALAGAGFAAKRRRRV